MSTPTNDTTEPVGSHPVGEKKRRAGWWWWLLLGLAAVVLLSLLSRCGDDDPAASATGSAATSSATGSASTSSATDSATTPSADASDPTDAASSDPSDTATMSAPEATPSTSPTTAAPADGAGGAGTVTTSEGIVLDDTTPRALQGRSGQDATGTGVNVQSVPADEGFWVGTSATNRIWVQLTGSGESAYQVKEGDTVDFTGIITDHDATFPSTVGVTQAEGADQLTEQGGHITVEKQAVTLSK